jgi:hypothetical protein
MKKVFYDEDFRDYEEFHDPSLYVEYLGKNNGKISLSVIPWEHDSNHPKNEPVSLYSYIEKDFPILQTLLPTRSGRSLGQTAWNESYKATAEQSLSNEQMAQQRKGAPLTFAPGGLHPFVEFPLSNERLIDVSNVRGFTEYHKVHESSETVNSVDSEMDATESVDTESSDQFVRRQDRRHGKWKKWQTPSKSRYF